MHEKLLKIQSELKAPKSQFNSFGKYKYRSCEDILEAVKPLLAREGLTLTLSDEMEAIGNRNYVKATATLTSPETSRFVSPVTGTTITDAILREEVKVTAYAREEEVKKGMDGSQITGAASSYARKYALNGLFLIDDAHDSDATNDHGKGEKKVYPAPATGDINFD
jgi:hypothetical protein